jgi:hypothetical protein
MSDVNISQHDIEDKDQHAARASANGEGPELTREERMELKSALIGEQASKALAFQTRATKKFGPAAGIMLRQLIFWEGRSNIEGGWLYKSRREMQDETGLSQRQQERARKALRACGVLEEDIRPVGPLKRKTLHYRVDLLHLMDLLDERQGNGESASDTGTPIANPVPESPSRIQYRTPYSDSGIQKRTSEDYIPEEDGSAHAASLHLKNDKAERLVFDTRSSRVAEYSDDAAEWIVSELDWQLSEHRGFKLSEKQRRDYEEQARALLDRYPEVSEDELDFVIRWKVMRWAAYPKLPLEDALQDVRSGHARKRMFDDDSHEEETLWELWSELVRDHADAEIKGGLVYYTNDDGSRVMVFPDGSEIES